MCRYAGADEAGKQAEAMCKNQKTDAKQAVTDMWQCGVKEFTKMGNPAQTLKVNPSFMQDSAQCAMSGLGM